MEKHPSTDDAMLEQLENQFRKRYDPELIEFSENMNSTVSYLLKEFSSDAIDDQICEDVTGVLVKDWKYYNQIATITGKILIESDLESFELNELLNEKFGDKFILDQFTEQNDVREGMVYGVDIKALYPEVFLAPDKDDEGTFTPCAAYTFSLDRKYDNANTSISALPNDLLEFYFKDSPSRQMTRDIMNQRWPDETQKLIAIFDEYSEDFQTAIVEAVKRLGVELKNKEFRKYTEFFMNREMHINPDFPVNITFAGSFDVLSDVEGDDDTEDRCVFETNGDIRETVYRPEVKLQLAKIPEGVLILPEFQFDYHDKTSEADERYDPQRIAIPAENIKNMTSLLPNLPIPLDSRFRFKTN